MKKFYQTVLIVGLLCSVVGAQNHPNSLVISNIQTRWDGEYPMIFGVNGDNYYMNDIFTAVLRQMQYLADSLDFVITTGDHTAGGDSAGYILYISAIDTLDVPWVTVMGNHEINDSLGWNRFAEYFGYPDFHFDLGNARFVGLTDCYPAPGPVSGSENVYYKFLPEQLDWLDSVLADWDGYKFVFIHNVPYLLEHLTIGTVGGTGMAPSYEESYTERFTDILRDNNVYVCFCGHYHCFDRWTADNEQYGEVTYIITGGAGGMLTPWYYPAPYGGAFYHSLVMELHEDGTLIGHIVRPDTIDDGITSVVYDTIYSFTLEPPSGIIENSSVSPNIIFSYPNPFNQICYFRNTGAGIITIHDVSGKIVDVVKSDNDGCAVWNPNSSIKSGIYFANDLKILFVR